MDICTAILVSTKYCEYEGLEYVNTFYVLGFSKLVPPNDTRTLKRTGGNAHYVGKHRVDSTVLG